MNGTSRVQKYKMSQTWQVYPCHKKQQIIIFFQNHNNTLLKGGVSFPIHVKYFATLLWRDVLRRDITNTPLMSIMGVWIWTINGEDGGFNRWWANYFSTYIFSLLCVKKHRNPNDNNRENLVDNWWGKDFFLHFNFICEYCYHWLTLVLASALCYNWMMDRRFVSDIGCQPAPPSHCIGCICLTFLHCVFSDIRCQQASPS